MGLRIGYGIDFHQLVTGRDLFIGGVKIPHDKGALGHSDADVLLHAICDALLGAACLGDIGVHFPDTSQEFKNIDSKILLAKTFELIKKEGIFYHQYRFHTLPGSAQDQTLCGTDAGSDRRHPVYFCKRYFHQSHYHRNHGFCWKKRRIGGACHLPDPILIPRKAYSPTGNIHT
jgi:hypothetical protein